LVISNDAQSSIAIGAIRAEPRTARSSAMSAPLSGNEDDLPWLRHSGLEAGLQGWLDLPRIEAAYRRRSPQDRQRPLDVGRRQMRELPECERAAVETVVAATLWRLHEGIPDAPCNGDEVALSRSLRLRDSALLRDRWSGRPRPARAPRWQRRKSGDVRFATRRP